MADVTVSIGGRIYPLSCRDGDEARVAELAGELASKAEGLTRSLGPMSEARLLLMAGLMVADELHDLRQSKLADWVTPPAPAGHATVDSHAAQAQLDDLAARAEALVDRLGGQNGASHPDASHPGASHPGG